MLGDPSLPAYRARTSLGFAEIYRFQKAGAPANKEAHPLRDELLLRLAAGAGLSRCCAEGLVDVGLDVFDVLQADGQPDVVGGNARGLLLCRSEL